MQRPTRIMVFGIFCLLVGGVSGFKNSMEAGLAFAGPDALEQIIEIAKQQQGLPETSEQSLRAEIAAQRKPVYRIGQAIESTGSAVMGVLLILAGIGLLRDKFWSLKFAKWWAYYAIPAAVVSVVLSTKYALPELPNAPTGGGMLNAAFMLIVFWAFPVLVLRQLPTQAVKEYLVWREQQRNHPTAMPMQSSVPEPALVDQPSQPLTDPTQSTPPATRSSDQTWRDDPWNAPGSK